jgi:hypothetical protein
MYLQIIDAGHSSSVEFERWHNKNIDRSYTPPELFAVEVYNTLQKRQAWIVAFLFPDLLFAL